MTVTKREPKEIAALAAHPVFRQADPGGFGVQVLVSCLPYSFAKKLVEINDKKTWDSEFYVDDPIAAIIGYLPDAFERALQHRTLSPFVMVQKIRTLAWVAKRSDVVAAMDAAKHDNYGVPKLLAACETLQGKAFETWEVATHNSFCPYDELPLVRMSRSQPCVASCKNCNS